MGQELAALEFNETWTIVGLPPGKRPIDCKWVYKLKFKAGGIVERAKAPLDAKGFIQHGVIDFHDTFSPVAKIVSIHCLLAVGAIKGWELQLMDINDVFLYGELAEEIYMRPPPGYLLAQTTQVC